MINSPPFIWNGVIDPSGNDISPVLTNHHNISNFDCSIMEVYCPKCLIEADSKEELQSYCDFDDCYYEE